MHCEAEVRGAMHKKLFMDSTAEQKILSEWKEVSYSAARPAEVMEGRDKQPRGNKVMVHGYENWL